ncbi:MAG: hypothetical protein Q4G68_00705 [Planctomycetia bacterium]|nr:hypothetical protein [Planctomycetia bacterium]
MPQSVSPSDFCAAAISSTQIQCQFTLPAGTDLHGHVQWQRAESDPETTNPVWNTMSETAIIL